MHGGMLTELLQERAALYAAGAMNAPERTEFELLLEFHEGLQAHASRLLDVAAAVLVGSLPSATPPSGLKNRILAAVSVGDVRGEVSGDVAKLRTGPTGLIEWVNPTFTAMCGYEFDELRGKKPGGLLQGALTEAAAVARLRIAIRAGRPIEEELVNYHKDGSPYRVRVAITPIFDDEHQPLYFVAKEWKLAMAG